MVLVVTETYRLPTNSPSRLENNFCSALWMRDCTSVLVFSFFSDIHVQPIHTFMQESYSWVVTDGSTIWETAK